MAKSKNPIVAPQGDTKARAKSDPNQAQRQPNEKFHFNKTTTTKPSTKQQINTTLSKGDTQNKNKSNIKALNQENEIKIMEELPSDHNKNQHNDKELNRTEVESILKKQRPPWTQDQIKEMYSLHMTEAKYYIHKNQAND